MEKTSRFGLSASALRLLALTFMTMDHLWATVIPGNQWLTFAGRLTFPIFAFQIVEGFYHTHDRRRYVKRLLLLAAVSEIPFNLVMFSSPVFPFHQNTVWTLLLGLWAVTVLERWKQSPRTGSGTAKTALVLAGIWLLSVVGFVDYGWQGMATVVVFYLFREGRFAKIGQLAAMVLLNIVLFKGQMLLLGGMEIPTQAFALLALIPIWLYNGEKGFGSKKFQTFYYVYYPAHLAILYFLTTLL